MTPTNSDSFIAAANALDVDGLNHRGLVAAGIQLWRKRARHQTNVTSHYDIPFGRIVASIITLYKAKSRDEWKREGYEARPKLNDFLKPLFDCSVSWMHRCAKAHKIVSDTGAWEQINDRYVAPTYVREPIAVTIDSIVRWDRELFGSVTTNAKRKSAKERLKEYDELVTRVKSAETIGEVPHIIATFDGTSEHGVRHASDAPPAAQNDLDDDETPEPGCAVVPIGSPITLKEAIGASGIINQPDIEPDTSSRHWTDWMSMAEQKEAHGSRLAKAREYRENRLKTAEDAWRHAKRGDKKRMKAEFIATQDDCHRRLLISHKVDLLLLRFGIHLLPPTLRDLNSVYRRAAKSLHEEYGSDTAPGYAAKFAALNEAIEGLRTFYVE